MSGTSSWNGETGETFYLVITVYLPRKRVLQTSPDAESSPGGCTHVEALAFRCLYVLAVPVGGRAGARGIGVGLGVKGRGGFLLGRAASFCRLVSRAAAPSGPGQG